MPPRPSPRRVPPGDPARSTPPEIRPAGLCEGAGHRLIFGNPAFLAAFGAGSIGLPVREVMLDFPDAAFRLLDRVLAEGRPLACWVERGGERWRLTAVPRRDPGTERVEGIAFHLRASTDLPVVAGSSAS